MALRLTTIGLEILQEATATGAFLGFTRKWLLQLTDAVPAMALELNGFGRDTGRCGTSSRNTASATAVVTAGHGVSFHGRFQSAPTSVTLSVRSSSAPVPTVTVDNVSIDGFEFTLSLSIAAGATAFWWGEYNAIA